MDENTKKCRNCGRELPLSEFYKNPKCTDGYNPQCKTCIKEKQHNPIYRAKNLLCNYNRNDRNNGRGKGDLTWQWIIENIFTKPCAHCGKTGWDVIGCNRLDNSKPHTMDNVEPCCKKCNTILGNRDKCNYSSQFIKRRYKNNW